MNRVEQARRRRRLRDPSRDAAPPALSIVIPVYRGEQTIAELVSQLADLDVPGGSEFVLVNDGSPDRSDEVCQELQRTCRVPITYVEHARNYGEHNAILTGLRHARGDYIVTMDDDLQNPPSEAVRLFEHARAGGWDVVYSRYPTKMHSAWRNLGSKFVNWMTVRLLDKPRNLYLSSFRCMHRSVASAVTEYRGPYPYVDGLILQATKKIASLEVTHLARPSGSSGYSLMKLIELTLNMALGFSTKPLRLALAAAVALFAATVLGGVAFVLHGAALGPHAQMILAGAILLSASLHLAALALVGEYVGRTLLTVSGKPQAIVRYSVRSPGEPVSPYMER